MTAAQCTLYMVANLTDWLQNMYVTIVYLWGRCGNVHVYRLGACVPMYVYKEKSLKKNLGMFKVQDQNSTQF